MVEFVPGFDLEVSIAPGADRSESSDQWPWVDVTTSIRLAGGISIDVGRPDERSTVAPGRCTLVFDNTDGDFTRTNPLGQWYGSLTKNTPLRVRVTPDGDDPVDLFVGEVPEWAPRWDKSTRNRTVSITAAGVLRRLQQGTPALRSPAFQALSGMDSTRVAYWPLEEQSEATTITSPVGSPEPGVAGEVTFGGYTDSPSSERMVEFGTDALLFFTIPPYTSDEHKVIGLWAVPSGGLPGSRVAMRMYTTGGVVPFMDLVISTTGSLTLNAYNNAFVVADSLGPVAFAINGRECMISVELVKSGSNISATLFVQYADGSTSAVSTDTLSSMSIGRIAYITIGEEDIDGVAFGHLGVATDASSGFENFIVGDPPGVTGYAGETAATRIGRLCEQAGIPVTVQSGDSEPMGPQLVDTVIANVRDCEKADHGVLYESGTGLAYQPRAARYVSVDAGAGAEVALALNGSTELGEPPEPTDDDQFLVNDVTVSRPDGGIARHEAAGAYAPDGPVGRYDTEDTVNIQSDYRLPFHAQWMVGAGTLDDPRWPLIHLQLSNNADLASRWLGVGVGSRITVTNPPTGVAPDTLDLFVEGWSCFLGDHQWTVAMNCSPARTYYVATADGSANTGRADTSGSELAYGVSDSATAFPLVTTEGPAWTTAAGDLPFDAAAGGERVSVTAMATATPAFVAAGDVAHADNASVQPTLPAGIAAGNLMLLVAAIRNSGTGTPDTPTGWTHLAGAANVRVFYRYHQTGDTAPTVSFTGGAAGATCSARIVGFTGLGHGFAGHTLAGDDYAEQLNASSDSIAYGNYHPTHAGGVEFIVGWKQNDHTGVSAVAGFTEAFDSFTTSGDDQSLFAQYRIYTTAAEIAAGSVTAGGGVSAVNRSLVFALRPMQTATVTRSVNTIEKTHAAGTAVELWQPYHLGL